MNLVTRPAHSRSGRAALAIGGIDDHVHALFSLSKNHALKKIVEEVKTASSKWMKAEGSKNADFYWQYDERYVGD